VVTKCILPKTTDEEDVAMYTLNIADFQRYQLETVELEAVPGLANESRQNYIRAIELLKAFPQALLATLMKANLNYAILMAEHLMQRKRAIELLTQHHRTLTLSFDKYPDDLRVQIKDVMALMVDAMTRWKDLETATPE
jgi:hypothetical protein